MSAIGTCPECGASRPLQEFLEDSAQRQALAQALALDARLAPGVLAYLKLWAKPGKRTTAPTLLRVLRELHELVSAGTVTRNRITHPAPVEYWVQGLAETAAKVTPPLEGHGYLLTVVHGLAAKAVGQVERQREASLQAPRRPTDAPAPSPSQGRAAEIRAILDTCRRAYAVKPSEEMARQIERHESDLRALGVDPSPNAPRVSTAEPEGLEALAANAPPEARAGLRSLAERLGGMRAPLQQGDIAP